LVALSRLVPPVEIDEVVGVEVGDAVRLHAGARIGFGERDNLHRGARDVADRARGIAIGEGARARQRVRLTVVTSPREDLGRNSRDVARVDVIEHGVGISV
jgi:hypothetical protein